MWTIGGALTRVLVRRCVVVVVVSMLPFESVSSRPRFNLQTHCFVDTLPSSILPSGVSGERSLESLSRVSDSNVPAVGKLDFQIEAESYRGLARSIDSQAHGQVRIHGGIYKLSDRYTSSYTRPSPHCPHLPLHTCQRGRGRSLRSLTPHPTPTLPSSSPPNLPTCSSHSCPTPSTHVSQSSHPS